MHQHLLMASRAAARAIVRGALRMRVCRACGFVFNAAFDPGLVDYGACYDNTQSCSPAFESYLDELAGYLVNVCGVREARIVEVGCGKGAFLRKLVAEPGFGNRGIGFDPSYVGPESACDGRARFVARLFDGTGMSDPPGVVVCRHVIEHIARPVEFLRTIAASLSATGTKDARVFFETPCVEWILRNQVVWDFFYEHCSLFDISSLAGAFRLAGFTVGSVRHTFGGQYQWLEAQWHADRSDIHAGQSARVSALPALAEQFAEHQAAMCVAWRTEVERLRRAGKVALWGAGAKGVTLANLIDPEAELVDCIVDVNPAKQGRFLPGTGHPILTPEQLTGRQISSAVVMNANYLDEIERTLAALGLPIAAVDLMSAAPV